MILENGEVTCASKEKEAPSYKRLEELVRQIGGEVGWLDRMGKEFNFTMDSLKPPE